MPISTQPATSSPVRRPLRRALVRAALAALLITPAGAALAASPASAATGCTSYWLYGVRGSDEAIQTTPDPNDPTRSQTDALGVPISQTYRALQAAMPTGSISEDSNKYPAALNVVTLATTWGATYNASVNDGVAKAVADITAKRAQCPGIKVILAGYSQGADVLRRALRQLPAPPAGNTFVLFYGDPMFHNEPTPIITGGGVRANEGVGSDASRLGLVPTPANLPAGLHVESFCHLNDPACQFIPSALAAAAQSALSQNDVEHLTYHKLDATDAAWRILQYFGVKSPTQTAVTARLTGFTCAPGNKTYANFLLTNTNTTTGAAVTFTAQSYNVGDGSPQGGTTVTTAPLPAGQSATVSYLRLNAFTDSLMVRANGPKVGTLTDADAGGVLVEHSKFPAAPNC